MDAETRKVAKFFQPHQQDRDVALWVDLVVRVTIHPGGVVRLAVKVGGDCGRKLLEAENR